MSKIRRVFAKEDEDTAFKGDPIGSQFALCTLCQKKVNVGERGVMYKCKEHAKSTKHIEHVKSLLSRNPKLEFKYESFTIVEFTSGASARDPRDKSSAAAG